MNLKKFIIVFLIFCGLSYYYFNHVLERRSEKVAKKAEEQQLLVLGKGEEISYVSIERDELSVEMVKEESGDWRIISPVNDEADGIVVGGIVSTLSIDKRVKDVYDTKFDYEMIGLAPPKMRIGIGYGDKRRYLLLGDQTYVGTNHYARWEDNDQVFLMRESFPLLFKKQLYSLRNKNLFRYDASGIQELIIKMNNSAVHLVKQKEGEQAHWWIVKPIQNRADDNTVSEYLNDLKTLMIKAFYDEKEEADADVAIGPDSNVIAVVDAEGKRTELRLGELNTEDFSYAAKFSQKPFIISVPKDSIKNLTKGYEHFETKKIFPIEPESVYKVIYEKQDRKVIFRRNNDAWEQLSPKPEKQKDRDYFIKELVQTIANLKYEIIVSAEGVDELALTDNDILFTISLYPAQEQERMYKMAFLTRDNNYYIKEQRDPNWFKISLEDYDIINTELKEVL